MKTDLDNTWIVCMGGEDWWYHSHAHFDIQIMKLLSQRVSVLYVCSIGMRMPSLRRDQLFWSRIKRKLQSISKLLKRITPQLYVYSPFPFPLYQYKFGRKINTLILKFQLHKVYNHLGIQSPIVWINTPTAWPVIEKFSRNGLIYQRTDDYTAYDFDNFNKNYIKSVDEKLLRMADFSIHVGKGLHDSALKITDRSLLLPQGVDEMFFSINEDIPGDVAIIPKPIIGYVGGMDNHKFDAKLVEQVAKLLPDCSFVLVGPPHPNVNALNNLSNVYFLGVKSHNEIPAYIKSFDVCMLPTAQTEWGLKCRPLKLMEYLAAKKPVVATPTPASTAFAPAVLIGDSASSWVDAIQRIITQGVDDTMTGMMDTYQLKTWDVIANQIWQHICQSEILCSDI